MRYETELRFAKELAHQAGEIMRTGLGISDTSWKADNSPVTEADISINTLVINEVIKNFPNDGVLGEEASHNLGANRKWVVDPIDGTQPFDVGAPVSTFCLGLVEKEAPVMGVVYDPYLDKMYTAISGEGAFCNDNPIKALVCKELNKQYVFVSSRMTKGAKTTGQIYDVLIDNGAKVFNFRSIVYGLMSVANGKSIASMSGYCHPWDVAAAQVILQEAGATVTDTKGNPLKYNQTAAGILASNGDVHQELLGLLKI